MMAHRRSIRHDESGKGDTESFLLPRYTKIHSLESSTSARGWIGRARTRISSLRAVADFERSMRDHTEFSEAAQLCDNFLAMAKKAHRGVFSTLCTYRGSNSSPSKLNIPEDISWSSCLNMLWSAMERNQDADFEMIIIFAQTPGVERTLSFVEMLAAFTHTRLQKLVSIPRELVVLALAVQWGLSSPLVAEVKELLAFHHEQVAAAWKPNFPSVSANTEHGPWAVTRTSFCFKYPTKDTLQEYITDMHTYVFRPFARQPQTERVLISIFENQSTQVHKVLAATEATLTDSKWLESGVDNIVGLPWELQILQIFSTIFPHIRSEYAAFLEKASADLIQTAADGRIYPTGSKVQHLLHLEDCRKVVLRTCDENITTVSNCLDYLDAQMAFPLTQEHHDTIGELRMLINDLRYLETELITFGPSIETARKTTRDQMELSGVRRTTLLTVLAGLYIPLSFVTSFFGMNVSQFTGGPSETIKNITNIDRGNANHTTPGPFQKIVTEGDNQSFEIKYYWAAAVPLTFFTILFPLIAGALVRWCLQMMSRGGTWWRAMFALNSLLFLQAPGFLRAQLIIIHDKVDDIEDYNSYDWNTVYNLQFAFLIMILLTFSIFAIIFLWNFIHALRRANWWAMLYWCVQSALMLLIMFFPHFLWPYDLRYTHKPLYFIICYGGGLVYWLLHGLGWWLRPQWYYRWDERRVKTKIA